MQAEKYHFFFDWSSTLSNDTWSNYVSNQRLLAHYGKQPLSYDQWTRNSCGNAIEFAKTNGVEAPDSEIQKTFELFYSDTITSTRDAPKPCDEIVSILSALEKSGSVLYVISSHPHKQLIAETQRYNVSHLFKRVEGSVFEKSSRIGEICKEEGIPKEKAFYIGSTTEDIRAAKEAGILSIAIPSGCHPKKKLLKECPTFLLENVSKIPALFFE